MRKLIYILLALISVNAFGQIDRSKAPKPKPAPEIQFKDAQTFELDNGLKVILVEDHKLPVLSVNLSLDVDPVLEKDAAGYVSAAGSLVKTGTKNRSKAQIDEAVDFIGADLLAYDNGLYGSMLKKHADELLSVFQDVLLNPTFPKEEFDKYITQLKTGLQTQKTSPADIAKNITKVYNYGENHPYGEVVTEKTADNITIEKIKDYYNTYYKPNVAYLVMVGDVTLKEAKKLANKYFGEWKRGEVPTHTYKTIDRPKNNQVLLANKDAATQTYMFVTYPVDFSLKSEDLMAAKVMNAILGAGGFSGRLFQNLREKNAWTYGAYSALSSDELRGDFQAYAQVTTQATDSAVVEIFHEMNRMKDELVSEKDLRQIKNNIAGSFARSIENPRNVARYALNIQKYGLPADFYRTYLTKLEAVTPEDVKRAAQKYLFTDGVNIVAVGDLEVLKKSMKKLSKDAPIILNENGQVVKNTAMAIPAGLTAEKVVQDYINAIGGEAKLKAIQSVKVTNEMAVMGMSMLQEVKMNIPKQQLSQKQMMNGQLLSHTVINGDKGKVVSPMAGNKELTGEELTKAKAEIKIFPELDYLTDDYQLKLLGVDNIEGESVYKVEVKNKYGETSVEYYNAKTKLTQKKVSAQGQATVTILVKNYTEKDGIKYPSEMDITAGPQQVKMTLKELDFNPTFNAADFE
ncbi:MAG: peptidase M16 [Bacteroidetes bacterium]|nr:MAG: peptidase M16 [Bacteroidota bacterium]